MENRQGEGKNSVGNVEAKELMGGRGWAGWSGVSGAGNGTTVIA